MTLERFASLCAAWGSDLTRWPVAEREAAAALVESSLEARALLAQAAALDDLLNEYTIEPADPALVQALLSRATASAHPPVEDRSFRSLRIRLAWWWSVLAGAGAAGLVVGSLAVASVAGSALPLPMGGPLGSSWPATAFTSLMSDDGIEE